MTAEMSTRGAESRATSAPRRIAPRALDGAAIADTVWPAVVPVLLAQSNWSNRQIASVAGVAPQTVNTIARQVASSSHVGVEHFDNPATWQDGHDYRGPVLGADGKTYPPRTVTAVVIDVPTAPAGRQPGSRAAFRVRLVAREACALQYQAALVAGRASSKVSTIQRRNAR